MQCLNFFLEYKKGSEADSTIYGPTFVLPMIPKIIEKVTPD